MNCNTAKLRDVGGEGCSSLLLLIASRRVKEKRFDSPPHLRLGKTIYNNHMGSGDGQRSKKFGVNVGLEDPTEAPVIQGSSNSLSINVTL
jgi:hypothetical protein